MVWALPADSELVVRVHVFVVLLVDLHRGWAVIRVLFEQTAQEVHEFLWVTWHHFGVYQHSDVLETNFGKTRVVTARMRINKGQAREKDHPKSKRVTFVKVQFESPFTELENVYPKYMHSISYGE